MTNPITRFCMSTSNADVASSWRQYKTHRQGSWRQGKEVAKQVAGDLTYHERVLGLVVQQTGESEALLFTDAQHGVP